MGQCLGSQQIVHVGTGPLVTANVYRDLSHYFRAATRPVRTGSSSCECYGDLSNWERGWAAPGVESTTSDAQFAQFAPFWNVWLDSSQAQMPRSVCQSGALRLKLVL